jgi:N utilization substance protein B
VAPGSRREARERALELLYEAESKGLAPDELLRELPIAPDEYAAWAVRGVAENAAALDALIEPCLRDWTLDRLPQIDREILRLAVLELRDRLDVPTGVVLSEAVELANRYSTDASSRFVNGVLARLATDLRP